MTFSSDTLHRLKQWNIHSTNIGSATLSPSTAVLSLCQENLCGFWNRHPFCPPHIENIQYLNILNQPDSNRWILQWPQLCPNGINDAVTLKGKNLFHARLLWLEKTANRQFNTQALVLIAGACQLCQLQTSTCSTTCQRPALGRPSLESLGIDVEQLLQSQNLPHSFKADRILWAALLLLYPSQENP